MSAAISRSRRPALTGADETNTGIGVGGMQCQRHRQAGVHADAGQRTCCREASSACRDFIPVPLTGPSESPGEATHAHHDAATDVALLPSLTRIERYCDGTNSRLHAVPPTKPLCTKHLSRAFAQTQLTLSYQLLPLCGRNCATSAPQTAAQIAATVRRRSAQSRPGAPETSTRRKIDDISNRYAT